MTNNNLEKILQELYEADASLKEHDTVLRKLVLELLEIKPQAHLDDAFRVNLKMQLMRMTETQNIKPSLIVNFMNSFKLVGAGAALAAVLFAGVWYFNNSQTGPANNFVAMTNKLNISRTSENAFGSLASAQQAGGQGGGNASSLESSRPQGGGGSMAGDAGASPDKMMIAPENPVNYRYVYEGPELKLSQTQVDVLKRQKNINQGGLSQFISNITFGLVNFDSFSNTKLESFSFYEDRELGYMVNVNLKEGTTNIYEHWPHWEALTMPRSAPIDISEVPADQVMIDAANAFLDSHGVDRSVYGTPQMNTDWRMYYDASPDKANYWIPEVMNVVYPLMIQGQPVYDEGGNTNGLNVGVRIYPDVRVSGVWELNTQNYESSAYEAETDKTRIMELVEKGGFRTYQYLDANAPTVEVKLGNPEVSYVKLWNYKDGSNEELLVPALIFPVLEQPEGQNANYWYRKNVVIPLVKEILDNEQIDGPPVRIMPAESGAASEGAEAIEPSEPVSVPSISQ